MPDNQFTAQEKAELLQLPGDSTPEELAAAKAKVLEVINQLYLWLHFCIIAFIVFSPLPLFVCM